MSDEYNALYFGRRTESLLKHEDPTHVKHYLIKMPQWVEKVISSSMPGAEIGFSPNIARYISPDEIMEDELRLVLSGKLNEPSVVRPSEYSLSAPATGHQTLRILQASGSISKASRVTSNLHMIPKRDAKYGSLLRERLNEADVTKQHRTLHNEQDYAQSIMSVKLFQRQGSPSDDVSAPRSTRKIRSLDELPQTEIRVSQTKSKSFDDVLMSLLVERDIGWPLQQLTKAIKDQGVPSVSMAYMKTKLLEICQYQRRGEDTHPKYYLKAEYK